MVNNFNKAKRILSQGLKGIPIVAINGCCYGCDDNPEKGEYIKLCGQRFWDFISGDDKLYIEIIEPLGHQAKERNEKFQLEYAKIINRFTLEFIKEYCHRDGSILWDKIVYLNSAKRKLASCEVRIEDQQ